MGRRKRPHSPGTVFHLVSRTHGGEPWFVPAVRTQVAELIPPLVARTDACLLAYAVMPNHLHLVVRQGEMELWKVMQPLLRRVAYRVQKHHGFEGGVVERRYRDRPCTDARHVRAAVLYTHLNPWRAGLCDDGLDYRWMTHNAYSPGTDPSTFGIDPDAQHRVLQLFALADDAPRDQLCRDYGWWLEWRMELDRRQALPEDQVPTPIPREPASAAAARAWRLYFAPNPEQPTRASRQGLPDLRDFVMTQVGALASGVKVGRLYGSPLSHRLARVRRRVMRAAAERGFRTSEIGRFFGVSPQTVSRAKYEQTTDVERAQRSSDRRSSAAESGKRKRGPECQHGTTRSSPPSDHVYRRQRPSTPASSTS